MFIDDGNLYDPGPGVLSFLCKFIWLLRPRAESNLDPNVLRGPLAIFGMGYDPGPSPSPLTYYFFLNSSNFFGFKI